MDERELQRNRILSLSTSTVIADRYRPTIVESESGEEHIRELGRGGSGVVILVDQQLAEEVVIQRAVKFYVFRDDIANLPANRENGPISAVNFRDEILNISAFNHENVLKVIEASIYPAQYEDYDIPFLVTEFVDGPTLKEAIDKHLLQDLVARDPKLLIDIIHQMFRGVEHLHERSFFHFDIAPKNIFLRGESNIQVVIGDLGIGKTISPSDALDQDTKVRVIGTRYFCPPEVASKVDEEVTLADLCAFQPRWDVFAAARTSLEFIDSIDFGPRRPPAWLQALRNSLEDAMAGRRFHTMAALAERVRLLDPTQHLTWGIPELSDGHTSKWLMAIEGPSTTPRIRALANHSALLRLKNVPQLMMMSRTFSGGNHTRYEHSLGTYQNTRRYLLSLLRDDRFLEFFSPSHVELALVAALLSNVTRFPLSSIFHEIRDTDNSYFSDFSRRDLLTEINEVFSEPSLFELIENQFPMVDLLALRELLVGDSVAGFDEAVRFTHGLLNSSVDARVLDYLRRDSFHLGISQGDPLELDDLMSHIAFRHGQLVVKSAGISAVEQIVATRYWLHNRIYWNRPNRTMAAMMKYILVSLHNLPDFSRRLRQGIFTRTEQDMLRLFTEVCREANLVETLELCEFLERPRPVVFGEFFQLNRSEGDANAWAICDGYEKLDISLELQLQSRLNRLFIDEFGMEPRRVHILLDMPVERGRMKLGSDINILTYRNEVEALIKLSGIVAGVQKGFQEHIQRLRVLIHPETERQMKEGQTLTDAKSRCLQILLTLA